ncbi:2'-5' RNA ligase family protein [Streptomyces sp. NPDC055140]
MTPLIDDSRAFPATPPSDLDDPQKITSNDWDAFKSVHRMTSHWDRPGWAPGDKAYYWMLAFPEEQELISQARSYQQDLAGLGMDEVPHDGLHITMNRIGSCADVEPSTVDSLAQQADGTLGGAFDIRAEPMAGSRGAIRFSVTPWTPLVELHTTLYRAGQRAGVEGGRPSSLFRPHLGILYNNRERPAAPVIDAVAVLRHRPVTALPVVHVELVELRQEDRTYRWQVLHKLTLPSRSPAR